MNKLLLPVFILLLNVSVVTAVHGDDITQEQLDSALIEKGEPECTHEGQLQAEQVAGDSAAASATATNTAHIAEDQEEIAAATEAESPPNTWDFLLVPKYYGFGILMIVGLILLFMRGVNKWVRIGVMAVVFILYGLDWVFPLHPSPMCAVTKLFMFRFTWGEFFPAFMAVFLAIMVPSLVYRKAFCGWVCPLGAMQELVNKIPFGYKFKNFNFTAFNTVRLAMLALFVLTFFWVADHITYLAEYLDADPSERAWVLFSSYNVYDPVNFFHLLHWNFDTLWIVGFIIIVLTSLMLYRPFCYAICPIGGLTWLLEKVAPGRVRVDHDLCTECGDCMEASPCPTIKPMVEKPKAVLPDCTSCGECVRACSEEAISFGFKPRK